VIRATSDIDVALAETSDESLKRTLKCLEKKGFKFPNRHPSVRLPLIYASNPDLWDLEIWLRPNGIVWDEETLRRRLRCEYGTGDSRFEAYVLSPEDFIVNKFARLDRTANDELDAAKVYINIERIDSEYLERRARQANVRDLVSAMIDRVRELKRRRL